MNHIETKQVRDALIYAMVAIENMDDGEIKQFDSAIALIDADLARVVEPVAHGVKQLAAQLHDDQKWTVAEQQQFAPFLARFPNESSQGIISLGNAWKHGRACASPQTAAQPSQARELFPSRIMEFLVQVSDRKGSECYGPWEDENGDQLQDDADAAIAWINAIGGAAQPSQAVKWMPIATAPKDGTRYLAYAPDYGQFVENHPTGHYAGDWVFNESRNHWRGHAHSDDREATHWTPLGDQP